LPQEARLPLSIRNNPELKCPATVSGEVKGKNNYGMFKSDNSGGVCAPLVTRWNVNVEGGKKQYIF